MHILETPEYKAAPWYDKVLINIFGVLGMFPSRVQQRPSEPRPKPAPPPPSQR